MVGDTGPKGQAGDPGAKVSNLIHAYTLCTLECIITMILSPFLISPSVHVVNCIAGLFLREMLGLQAVKDHRVQKELRYY